MVRILFLIFLLLIFNCNQVFALDVVYPASKNTTINATSTFIFGTATPGAMLKINQDGVKVDKDGIFVHIVPLFTGENNIKIESKYKNKKQTLNYKITRNKISSKSVPLPYVAKKEGTYLYTKTNNDAATVREKPSSTGKRVLDLQKGVVLYIAGKQGDYYKIEENGKTDFWIHKSNVDEPTVVTKKFKAKVKKEQNYSDKLYNYTKIPITHPVLYTFEQNEKSLTLTLYSVENKKDKNNANLEFVFEDENQVVGYDGKYDEDFFIVRRAKVADKINPHKPLFGVRIFVDAGHGGSEKGAIGPTRICEKDINLAIAKKLIKILKEEGAIVSYSRIDDRQVKLNDRVKLAKENNAFISLSIHNNSLPNDKNPLYDHGTEIHYYNENAKVLAYITKENLVKDLGLKDNGIHKTSFALNRSTNPISILIEVAYMINPDEYRQLKKSDFQQKAAKSIAKSLKEYMILLKK